MEISSVFDEKFKEILETDVRIVMLKHTKENAPDKSWESQNTNNMSCSYCHVDFTDVATQREHYKRDWHRFNLKQSLLRRNPITEQEFELKILNDDISSISGSDSEEDTLDSFATAQGKMFLQSENGQIYSIYKYIAFNKKVTTRFEMNEKTLLHRLRCELYPHVRWTVLMLVEGHFACAVFQGTKLLVHTTFHPNTDVREGQSGSESSRDNKCGGSNPRSAAASSIKYNEQALVQYIRDVVKQWKDIEWSNIIFYRAPGPYSKSVLFGGTNPIFKKSDKYLRSITFSTGRASLEEIQRIHSVLVAVHTYENLDAAVKHLDGQRLLNLDHTNKRTRSEINRAKSREIAERPLPTKHSSETNSLANSLSESEEFESLALHTLDHEIPFEQLQEFESIEKRKEKSSKKSKPKKTNTKKLQEQEVERKNELINIICKGKVLKLKELIENDENESNAEKELKMNFLNEILDEDGNSLLHMAAMNEHSDLVKFLLENDSDPCVKNKKLQTAYSATSSEEVRNVMREFAREYPEKYDYNMAQIPVNILTPEELAEKKESQKKIKNEKENIKRAEDEVEQNEEIEKERFLK